MNQEMKHILYNSGIPAGKVTAVEWVPEGADVSVQGLPMQSVPEHIKVNVECLPEEGSFIRIEIWLPTKGWNGDFIGTGNGGAAGMIVPFVMSGPLRLGFAVANTDMGTSAGVDCGMGNKAVWTDFGHRATHLMTLAAKAVIEKYYGTPARYSYFIGSSTGGQQGLSEAQRYPEDYDGILVNSPAHNRTNLHIAFVWDWLALNHSEESKFTQEDAKKAVKAILKHCKEEGEGRKEDAFMYRPDKIHMCREIFADSGLSAAQKDALMKIYEGPKDPVTGEQIHVPMVIPGSEACDLGLAARCDEAAFERDFFYLFRWIFGKEFDFKNFDFHKDTLEIRSQLDSYLNAMNPDLSAFRKRGGKLLLIHGTADPIIPYTESIEYYHQVQACMGEDIKDFFRLYLAPGMAHTSGGPGVQDITFGFPATPKDSKHLGILALKDWVEKGIAPEKLYPVAFRDGDMMNAFLEDGVAYEREICPFTL